MKKRIAVFLALLTLALYCPAFADLLSTLNIKDKQKTQEIVLKLYAQGPYSFARINNVAVDMEQNGFSCGLVLNPGKNFMKVEAWDTSGGYEEASRRIIRLISFPDVEKLYNGKTHWAKTQIVTLATLGIIEGAPDGNYYVSSSTTRGEFATWLCKAEGYKISVPERDDFKDVPREHWRAPYVYEVAKRGLMRGDAQGDFGVDTPISRGEAALTTLKAEGASFEREIISTFYDVPKTNPFYDQIKFAKTSGLIKGVSWKTAIFEPQRELTHAEAAILLSRFNKVKHLTRLLYDFNQGYDQTAYCKINTAPKVQDVQITPAQMILGGNSPMNLMAKIESREGLEDLLYVKADISQLNGPADAEMIDDGTRGDPMKGDGEYYLQFFGSAEATGERTVTVTATDVLGWQGSKDVKIVVVK